MNVSRKYRTILDHVTAEPQTATQIYRAWAGLPERSALPRRRRNERRWVAHALENLTAQGVIERDYSGQLITFRRPLEAHDAPSAEPRVATGRGDRQ